MNARCETDSPRVSRHHNGAALAAGLEKLAGVVAGAQVDINPYQVDAALFAFQSPLSRGALLADSHGCMLALLGVW